MAADEPTPKRPPRAKRAPRRAESDTSDTTVTPRTRRGSDSKIREAVADQYRMVGMLMFGAGMARDNTALAATGGNVAAKADTVAEAWMQVADQNESVKKWLARLVEVTAVGNLLAIHFSLAAPLFADQMPEPLRAMFTADAPTPAAD